MEWKISSSYSPSEGVFVIFKETALPGAFTIELERRADERGFFARTWCQREFAEHQLNAALVQCSISFNKHKGTLRGIHYQTPPFEEAKLVRCTSGAIYDVIVDLRQHSPAFKQSFGINLTAHNHTMLYIPEGIAHGFLTLGDNTEVFYQMSEVYCPTHCAGIRWNDPLFGVQWPFEPSIMSERDRNYSDFIPSVPTAPCSQPTAPC